MSGFCQEVTMFKHRLLAVVVHDTRINGPRPTLPAKPSQAGKATIDAEQQRLAGGADKHVTEEAFVKDRLEREGANLSPDQRKDLEARLREEFKHYDGNQDGLDEAEFLNLMQDRAQSGGDTHLAAGDLSDADKAALNTGITERGEAVKARQHQLNEQIKAGKIPGPPLKEDGLEGPKTRAAMAAAGKLQRAEGASIGGAVPQDPAAKDAAYDHDTQTLADANAAFEAMPPGAAKDAMQKKVEDLAKAYDQKWGSYQKERQAVDAVNGLLANPPKPGENVNPEGQQQAIQQAETAMKDIPEGPRKQELQRKLDAYKQACGIRPTTPTPPANDKLKPYLDASGKLDPVKLEADRAAGKVDLETYKAAVKQATPEQRGFLLSQLDDWNSISGGEKAFAEAIVKQAEADGTTGAMVTSMQANGTLDQDTSWAVCAYSSPTTLAKVPHAGLQAMYDHLPAFSSLGVNAYHDAYQNAHAALHGGGGAQTP
jgi:hypothetical protein